VGIQRTARERAKKRMTSDALRGCLIIIVNDRVVYFMLRCSL
jgi:hypothetical protein